MKEKPPKVIVRKRDPSAPPPSPQVEPDPWDRFRPHDDRPFDDRPKTGHDLYLTYDIKGKLRTHTVYHSPVDPRTIAVRPGKKKKKEESPEA